MRPKGRISQVLLALLLATACQERRQPSLADDTGDLARLRAEFAVLKNRMDRAEERRDLDMKWVRAIDASLTEARQNHDALIKTFNGNVRLENEQARRERTAAGVCGQEQVWRKDGTYVIQNKDCPPR